MEQATWGAKTDSTLLERLRSAAGRRVSPAEIQDQRVSFAYGSLSSRSSEITREQVRRIIEEQAGAPDRQP